MFYTGSNGNIAYQLHYPFMYIYFFDILIYYRMMADRLKTLIYDSVLARRH